MPQKAKAELNLSHTHHTRLTKNDGRIFESQFAFLQQPGSVSAVQHPHMVRVGQPEDQSKGWDQDGGNQNLAWHASAHAMVMVMVTVMLRL